MKKDLEYNEIRSDLWESMSKNQLHKQQELLNNRISQVNEMMINNTGEGNDGLLSMIKQLEYGLVVLDKLLNKNEER